ncbi:MAG: tetratricopeptide repeat protein [Paracoccaceae bacterium]
MQRIFGISLACLVSLSGSGAISDASGPYLAAQSAMRANDFGFATQYQSRVLTIDRDNAAATRDLLFSYVALGRLQDAIPVANLYSDRGADDFVTNLIVLLGQIEDEDFAGLSKTLENEGNFSLNPFIREVLTAWTEHGLGNVQEAQRIIDDILGRPGFETFAAFHRAMMHLADGKNADALQGLGGFENTSGILTNRALLIKTALLQQMGQSDHARAFFNANFSVNSSPESAAILRNLDNNEPIVSGLPRTVSQAMSEIFFTLALFIREQVDPSATLVYARIAEALNPQSAEVKLFVAGVLEELDQYKLALNVYEKVGAEDPKYYTTQISKARAMRRSQRVDDGIDVLNDLAAAYPDVPVAHATLGDFLSRQDRYDEALTAYNAAISMYEAQNNVRWQLYYARGIIHERLKIWPNADQDFRSALALNPDQASVLNYLGYSLIERGEKLDEAMEMITKAVEIEPNSGYIVDSLGWGKFRLGQYEEAVPDLERAAELMATDPIVNDHLGDAYWAVGRKNEARFQWRRALSFNPEEVEETRIKRKLQVGLDQLLSEEGMPALYAEKQEN